LFLVSICLAKIVSVYYQTKYIMIGYTDIPLFWMGGDTVGEQLLSWKRLKPFVVKGFSLLLNTVTKLLAPVTRIVNYTFTLEERF